MCFVLIPARAPSAPELPTPLPLPPRPGWARGERQRFALARLPHADTNLRFHARQPRANREAVCLESRGYVTTTRVFMRPSPEDGLATYDPPDPVRRCYQQAFAWMGRYDGPVDGHSNVIWTTAQKAYLTEIRVTSDAPNASELVRERLRQELQGLGKAADWQACLQEATQPQ